MTRDAAFEYHAGDRPGKIEVKETKPCLSPRDIRMAHIPGALGPARAIAADPAQAYLYTARGNLIAVVTNGSGLPGLGDLGPAAAKPLAEGLAVLFKRFADIDTFDLELDTRDTAAFVETVRMLEPTFGGINVRDISAPAGLEIYDQLCAAMSIPVFHGNHFGIAVVAAAGLANALALVDKDVTGVRVVACGAGTVGLGCLRLLRALGVPADNITLYDVHGLLHPDRPDLNEYQREFAHASRPATLAEALVGADVFLGASAAGVLTQDLVRGMAGRPIVMALATPDPEIEYAEARAARHDVVVFTSRTDDPNGIGGLLSSPYIFRGALDVQASRITQGMMLAAANALAELAREEVIDEVTHAYGRQRLSFGPEYLLPRPIDPRILLHESAAVAARAIAEGVARRPLDPEAHRESLMVRIGSGRDLLRQVVTKARRLAPRIVFPDGATETVLRACAILVDEGIASPILLGSRAEIRDSAERLGLQLAGSAIIEPANDPRLESYTDELFRMRCRRGLIRDMAAAKLRDPLYFACLMLQRGDADMVLAGISAPYAETLRKVLEVIGPAPGVHRIAALQAVLRRKEAFFLADVAVNIEPDADQLAEIALLSAATVRALGIEPRVAMLAFSNLGSVDHPLARKVREATHKARARDPQLVIEGEIQLTTALNEQVRERYFPFCQLQQNANVLIFPDLQSGHLALHLLEFLGDTVGVGPLLMGTRRPVHVLQYSSTVQDVVNLAALGAVYAGESAPPAVSAEIDAVELRAEERT